MVVGGVTLSQDALAARTTGVLGAQPAGTTAPSSAQPSDTSVPASSTTALAAAADPAARSRMNRIQITDIIRHQLVTACLTAGCAAVSDAQVTQVLQTNPPSSLAAQLQIPQADVAATVRDVLVLDQLLRKVPAAGERVQDVVVQVEGLSSTDRAGAVADRGLLLGSAQQISAALSAAGARALKPTALSLVKNPGLAPTGLFQAAVGDVLVIGQGNPQYPFAVVRVMSRTVSPQLLTTAGLSGQNTVTVIALGSLLLTPYAAGLNVRVNPRFGVWDPASLQVVPGNSGL